jgi:hypothetical protein
VGSAKSPASVMPHPSGPPPRGFGASYRLTAMQLCSHDPQFQVARGCILYGMEVDWFTRSIAIYGAALATITQASQLWKDRVKVHVGAFYEATSDAGVIRLSALIVRATNIGRRSVRVKGVFVHEGKEKRFITARKPSNTLEPTQEIELRYDPELVTDRITKLGVFDTEGREWALHRRYLKDLKKNRAPYRRSHK